MRLAQILAPAAGLLSLASAWDDKVNTIYTTVVTTAYETYCPSPTTFAFKNVTYTATTATTLTITNCPCTVTTKKPPPYTTTTTYCPPESSSSKPPKYHNTTTVITVTPPPETTIASTTPVIHKPTPTPSKPATVPTAAAQRLGTGVGALVIAGIVGLMM